jgi:hypothetical protein
MSSRFGARIIAEGTSAPAEIPNSRALALQAIKHRREPMPSVMAIGPSCDRGRHSMAK